MIPQRSLKVTINSMSFNLLFHSLVLTPCVCGRFSIGLAMSMMYGYDIKSVHDPVIEVAEEGNVLAAKLIVPGGSLINVFPFLRHIPAWVPGASSRKQAMAVKKLTDEMMRIPTDFVKKSLVSTLQPRIVLG